MRPCHGFWGTGLRGIYFKETGVLSATFEGNKQTKKILGNMEHRKTIFFDFGGTGEQANALQPPCPPPHPCEGLAGVYSG